MHRIAFENDSFSLLTALLWRSSLELYIAFYGFFTAFQNITSVAVSQAIHKAGRLLKAKVANLERTPESPMANLVPLNDEPHLALDQAFLIENWFSRISGLSWCSWLLYKAFDARETYFGE